MAGGAACQRYSTVQVVAPEIFQKKTLWPEYLALAKELEKHFDELTERVLREAIDGDVSEADESDGPRALPEGNRS